MPTNNEIGKKPITFLDPDDLLEVLQAVVGNSSTVELVTESNDDCALVFNGTIKVKCKVLPIGQESVSSELDRVDEMINTLENIKKGFESLRADGTNSN